MAPPTYLALQLSVQTPVSIFECLDWVPILFLAQFCKISSVQPTLSPVVLLLSTIVLYLISQRLAQEPRSISLHLALVSVRVRLLAQLAAHVMLALILLLLGWHQPVRLPRPRQAFKS